MGPAGNNSTSLQEIDKADPITKRLLGSYDIADYQDFEQLKEYYSILQKFQFYYQHYVSGELSKTDFLSLADKNAWSLADTVYLSRQPLRVTCRVLVGTKKGTDQAYYIVDGNQNQSYGDDPLQPFLPPYTANPIVTQITLDFYTQQQISGKQVNVVFTRDKNATVFIGFRSYPFARFTYQGIPYILCNELHYPEFKYILPDRPYFEGIPREQTLKSGSTIILGTDSLQVVFHSYQLKVSLLSTQKRDLSKAIKIQPAPTVAAAKQAKIPYTNLTGADVRQANIQRSIDDYKGKWILLYFWSNYCAPCIQSLPKLNALYETYHDQGLEILGVMDVRNQEHTLKLLQENQVAWPNIQSTGRELLQSVYAVQSYPTIYLINPEGYIEKSNLFRDDLERTLHALLPL